MRKIRMPSPAENVEAVTLAAWRVKPGAAAAAGAPLADLVTEKASFTLETEAAGVVTHLLASPGSVLPPGFVIALLDADAADAAAAEAENAEHLARFGAPAAEPGQTTPPPGPGSGPSPLPAPAIRATPAARRLAKELGLNLESVAAAQPPGTLLKEDHVRAAAK